MGRKSPCHKVGASSILLEPRGSKYPIFEVSVSEPRITLQVMDPTYVVVKDVGLGCLGGLQCLLSNAPGVSMKKDLCIGSRSHANPVRWGLHYATEPHVWIRVDPKGSNKCKTPTIIRGPDGCNSEEEGPNKTAERVMSASQSNPS